MRNLYDLRSPTYEISSNIKYASINWMHAMTALQKQLNKNNNKKKNIFLEVRKQIVSSSQSHPLPAWDPVGTSLVLLTPQYTNPPLIHGREQRHLENLQH